MTIQEQSILYNTILVDLSHLGLIKVTGADAEKFLQGQLTNDVRQVNENCHQLNALCSQKGRIIANFHLFKRNAEFYLLLPKENINSVLERLQKYILRAAVKLEEASQTLACFGIAGEHSTQIITDCLGYSPPSLVNATITVETTTILQIHGVKPRYILISDKLTLQKISRSATILLASVENWQLLDILAGLPSILPTITEEFVPQMVNFDVIGGISFKKGCYTGQEIVARMQYLGTLKRRMYLAKLEIDVLPQAGDKLYISDQEQSIGKIVNAQVHPNGGVIMLAVIQINSAKNNAIHLINQKNVYLQLLALPYQNSLSVPT